MTPPPPPPRRRVVSLTRERIVMAAIEILDGEGEAALTFRALAGRLATGSGALYWHVADKEALLSAAAEQLTTEALSTISGTMEPRLGIRAIAAAAFDLLETHPWIGSRLAGDPLGGAALQIYEGIGGKLGPLGVPPEGQFSAWSALVNYILGAAEQNAANARHAFGADRTVLLSAVADRWRELDAEAFPFLRQIAADIPGHDDREQFLAGIDLILDGIAARIDSGDRSA